MLVTEKPVREEREQTSALPVPTTDHPGVHSARGKGLRLKSRLKHSGPHQHSNRTVCDSGTASSA